MTKLVLSAQEIFKVGFHFWFFVCVYVFNFNESKKQRWHLLSPSAWQKECVKWYPPAPVPQQAPAPQPHVLKLAKKLLSRESGGLFKGLLLSWVFGQVGLC